MTASTSQASGAELILTHLQHSSMGVIQWDADHRIVRWEGAAERIFGWSAAEALGQRIDTFPPAHDADALLCTRALERIGSGREASTVARYRSRTRSGQVRHCQWNSTVIVDAGGHMASALSFVIDLNEQALGGSLDVTELQEAERRSHAERDLLHDFVMSVPACVVITRGPEHVFAIVNALACKMLGGWDFAGRPLRETFPLLDPIVYERFDRVYRVGETIEGREFSISLDWDRTGTPTSRYLDFIHQPLRGSEGQILGVMTFALDVTAQVEARRNVEQLATERAKLLEHAESARADAEQANRAKDEFLAMLGHELRNPLAPIQTVVDLMKIRGRGQLTREQAVIERQVMHLTRLVDDLLDVSRIARGKIQLKSAPVDVRTVVTKAVEMVSPLFEERHHRLVLDVPSGGLRVQGDEARLVQVLANLLSNAAQYTNPGGQIEVHAGYRKVDGEGEIVTAVTDTGVGISPELLPRIFDLFFQGGQCTPGRAKGGLGLGLAIVRNLVEMHSGKVTAYSAGLGHGSEFTVRLPALIRAAEQIEVAAAPRIAGRPGGRVLVVDDNQDAAETLAEILRTVGYEVAIAYDGPGAFALASTFRPEIGILDIGLPVMDGYELAGRLRELCGPLHLIAVTGYGQEQDRLRSEQAGFAEHFVKPVDVDQLLQALRAAPLAPQPTPPPV